MQPLVFAGLRMSPEAVQSFYALMLGFAWAGFLATGYQAATKRPASFRLLQRGPRPSAFAAIPFLACLATDVPPWGTHRRRRPTLARKPATSPVRLSGSQQRRVWCTNVASEQRWGER